ncbi:Ldh family oxidoreductase [Nocardioides humi]|uniref:Malate/lactate/ureidoglycolate dehydrogenase, LDH2 family n=1 Tax=Nocardioides humi TaxID=449461 RepID=A0ABN2A564_9ACTN|nr:Ldh family oxidoreductase [Nocardioides humi]
MTDSGGAGREPRPTDTVTLPVVELVDLVRRALEHAGLPPEEAAGSARVCVAAEVRGKRTHGLTLLPQLIDQYQEGEKRRRPVSVVARSVVSEQLDGGFNASLHLHAQAASRAASLASEVGVGLVSIVNAGVSGALGVHVEEMARRGVVAIAINSTPAVVVPLGGSEPLLGTNPMAWAVPRRDGHPVVLDMATSSIAYHALRRAVAEGRPVPRGVVVDAQGAVTTDLDEAVRPDGRPRILPFGGHRGSALSILIELTVAAGLGQAVGSAKAQAPLGAAVDFPGVYLAWRPDVIGSESDYHAATEQLLADLVAGGATYPGRSAEARLDLAAAEGRVEVVRRSVQDVTDLLAQS